MAENKSDRGKLYAQQDLIHGEAAERNRDGTIRATPRTVVKRGAEVPFNMAPEMVEQLTKEGLLGPKPPGADLAKPWRPTTGIVGEDPVQEKKVAEI